MNRFVHGRVPTAVPGQDLERYNVAHYHGSLPRSVILQTRLIYSCTAHALGIFDDFCIFNWQSGMKTFQFNKRTTECPVLLEKFDDNPLSG